MKPVNLNKFRKTKARADKRARADENAVKFGLSKSQKSGADLDRARATDFLDGHKTKDPED